ncbi:MAG: c-type cytochrome [Planctomycetaceae bacterium]|nr:c-type cytochrome [Planctomycetales bacterium]MCB9922955.1 c-type cytochrome [Planctomycetaceae bacterium]
MSRQTATRIGFVLLVLVWGLLLGQRSGQVSAQETSAAKEAAIYRSPVDLTLAADESWLATANQTSGTVSLIESKSGTVLDEVNCGEHPASIVRCLDDRHLLVSCSYSGDLVLIEVQHGTLQTKSVIHVGFEPVGIAVAPDGQHAFVGLVASGEVAEVDLVRGKLARRFGVGKWPRYLTVSPDGSRLAVGCSGENKIVVVDAKSGERLYEEGMIGGINIGHMLCSHDGQYAYFPWMVYRSNPITPRNIQLGWVLASRIGRVRLDGPSYREAISLDVPRMAVADPHGIAMSSDERRLVVTASGTHELLVYRQPDLPYVGVGGPGDLIDRKLLTDNDLFYRIDVGGRPMGIVMASDNRTAYVANHVKDCIQEVDIESRKLLREISLGPSPEPSLARRGMEIFYDGRRSLDQWYSCHSCHYNGGVNSKAMDTMNDGSQLTMKTVLPLYHVHQTGPWTWHGWQTDLHDAMGKSFTTTMQGRKISEEDTRAVLAYLESLEPPRNPYRSADGSLSEAAVRGKRIFESREAACANCHSGDYFTDGKIHDVGLGADEDRYNGFNTPSLRGVYRKVRFLHDGRAKSLEEVLTDEHSPEKVAGEQPLSESQLSDLIAYLKSL